MKIQLPYLMKIESILASIAAAFIPVAVFFTSHAALLTGSVTLWILTLAGLAYSVPSVAAWSRSWTGCKYKALAFTVLLEGVMTFSGMAWLAIPALLLLAGVNATVAWHKVHGKTRSTFATKRSVKRKATVKRSLSAPRSVAIA